MKHHIAMHVLGPHAHVLAVDDGPDALGAHDHAVAKRQVGARLDVLFHKAGELQQKADGARLGELPAKAGGDDCRGVEDLDADIAAKQAAQALDRIADGAQARDRGAHRHRKKDALSHAPEHELAGLDLEAVVLEAGLERGLARPQADLGARQGKRIERANSAEHVLAALGLEGHQKGAHRSVGLGGADTVEAHEPIRDAAGLFLGHEVSAAAQAQSSGELRHDVEDH